MSEINWSEIGFGYHPTKTRYVINYKEGQWGEGFLTEDANIVVNESSSVFQYAQTCFEGLKVYQTVDGRIVAFRPDLNAQRMSDTCARLEMPSLPAERFMEALNAVVKDNLDMVPPYGTGASMYIRPFIIGTGAVLGVKPADEYQFRLFGSPVGPYFKGGVKPISIRTTDYDRAAPHGTGNVKAGLNYAMSLYPIMDAHRKGFDENLYLDSATRTYIEETGGANIVFITKDKKKIVTPKSDSILPSITRRSIVQIAGEYLGLEVEERKIAIDEIGDSFCEAALCGTAAVISPIGKITHGDKVFTFGSMDEAGEVCMKLYETVRGIQLGTEKAPEGWIYEFDVK